MSRSRLAVVLPFLAMVSAAVSNAQSAVDPSGHWEGAVEVPNKPFGLIVDLAKRPKGDIIGTFAAVGSDTKGLPLSDVSVDGTTIRFRIKSSDGGSFVGKFSQDGKTMSGDFTTADGAHTLAFSLKRTGDAQIETVAPSPAIGANLVGTWTGSLQ